jgi:hypothetical protein
MPPFEVERDLDRVGTCGMLRPVHEGTRFTDAPNRRPYEIVRRQNALLPGGQTTLQLERRTADAEPDAASRRIESELHAAYSFCADAIARAEHLRNGIRERGAVSPT